MHCVSAALDWPAPVAEVPPDDFDLFFEEDEPWEVEVGGLLELLAGLVSSDEEDEVEVEEEDEDSDASEDWADSDSSYNSLSEEDEEEVEGEEDDQQFPPEDFWHGWRQAAPPAQAVEPVARPASPAPQQRAESLSLGFREMDRDLFRILYERNEQSSTDWDLFCPGVPAPSPSPAPSSHSAPCSPVLGSAPDFLPLGGSKRHREEDEEEDPSSKRPCLSSSCDSPDDPSPSYSAGTSGGFTHYFHLPHLFQDSESDEV